MLSRQYAKLCDVQDFADPAFRKRAASIRPELDLSWQFDRKTWESAMLTFFLEDVGALDGDSQVLSVGAGREAVMFWLAPRVKRIVGVDTYGHGRFAGTEAPAQLLAAPERFSPYEHDLSNLELRDMDARALEFPDGSFDAVYSLSSIEHFGSPEDIRRAAAEVGRVLRPGGHAYIATELVIEPAAWVRNASKRLLATLSGHRYFAREVFTREELATGLVDATGLELIQPLDETISPESFDNLATRRLRRLHYRQGRFHPHVVLRVGGETFTSVGLPFRKPPVV